MKPVFFLMGPTATGKTDLAAALTEHLPIELISVDAALVYRKMDIGTAKPDQAFLEKYPHHLINMRDVDQEYSAADFCQDARALIEKIHARGNIALLVGGSMFYYAALEQGLSPLPSSTKEVRQKAQQLVAENGLNWMHKQLTQLDPEFMRTIKYADRQRIQRAYEIYLMTGQRPSHLMHDKHKGALPFPIRKIGLFHSSRSYLHGLIEKRFHIMLEQGLEAEVRTLLDCGLKRESMAARIVGYRQMIEYIDGQISYEQMQQSAIASTRQLAKRQLTWMRNQRNLIWLPVDKSKPLNQLTLSSIKIFNECLYAV